MLEDLGTPKPTYNPEDYQTKKKSISPFDFTNSITYTKENLIVDDWSEKQYNPFLVNKSLSHGNDTVHVANEMNSRPHIDKKMQYDFLIGIVRKKKRFNKWIKPERESSIEIVKEYFGYTDTKAIEALRILSDDDLQSIIKLLNKGGKN